MTDGKAGSSGALFSIGQMAGLFGMSIRTLRYYDKIGLLQPEYVNPETNYRYYSSAQFERLNTIKYLRALDISIERIAAFFERRDVALMRGIFADQLADVEAKRRELERIERKVRARIAQIDAAVEGPLDAPELVELPERRVVTLARSLSPADDLEPHLRDLTCRADMHDAVFLGKVGVSISRDDLAARRFDRLSGMFIVVEAEDAHTGDEGAIPKGTFAQLRFRGTHADAAPAYAKLLDFAERGGYRVAGDSVETTLVDSGMTADRSQFVTELQIPLAR